MSTNICPKTWMTESILVTIFCCLPFGIVGIVHAAKVSSLYAAGSFDEAEKASLDAKKWMKIGFIIGIIYWVLVIVGYGSALLSQF